VRQGTKVRFQINTDAAARARLTLSSQLLRLALIIRPTGR
jgi:YfiR/HmsC-like